MKAILEFNLPEEATEHRTALNGWKWKAVLRSLYYDTLRPYWEYGDDLQKSKFAEEIWKKLYEKLQDYDLSLDDD